MISEAINEARCEMRDDENKKIRIKDVIELFAKICTIILAVATIRECIIGGGV